MIFMYKAKECKNNVDYTRTLSERLGFLISEKSIFTSTQTLHHLGFSLDSINMEVKISDRKKNKFLNFARS